MKNIFLFTGTVFFIVWTVLALVSGVMMVWYTGKYVKMLDWINEKED